jgi:spermidine/putrescine transport system substrate-binding protein
MSPITPRNDRSSVNRCSQQGLPRSPQMNLNRRRFLQASAAAMSGVALSNCTHSIGNPGSTEGSSANSPTATSSAASSDILHVYTWSTYMDNSVLKDFTATTGIQVVADIYDSNETMLAKLQAGGGAAYSIVYPSDYMVKQMTGLNLLTPLDKSIVKGLDNLLDKWVNPIYDANNTHSVPYAWGTTGLVYNSKGITTPPTDWSYLWDNQDKLSQRMTLLNDVREVMGAVLKSLGYSYNATDSKQIEAAYQKLLELKPAVASFTTDSWRDQLVTGDLVLAMGYSIDAIDAATANPNLKYVIPASGSSVWTDTIAIPKTAPNLKAAYAWINYMYAPESAARVVNNLKFATPNRAALDLIDPALKSNSSLFPPAAILAKCEGIAPVPANISELLDKDWTKLTSA